MGAEIITGFLGGVVGSVVTAIIAFRKDNREDYTTIIGSYRAEFDRKNGAITHLEQEVERFSLRVATLQSELTDMKLLTERYAILESAHLTLPLPFWVKDLQGNFLYANDAYESEYLIPNGRRIEDYRGKTDREFWGDDIAASYVDNDNYAKANGIVAVQEFIVVANKRIELMVIKYPIKIANITIGVGGIGIDMRIFKNKTDGIIK